MKYLSCKNCNHVWKYKGSGKFYATCGSCYYKVNIRTREVTEDEFQRASQ